MKLVIVTIVALFSAACTEKRAPVVAAVEPPKSGCAHQWAKWTAPDVKSDWWYGTRVYQQRVCEKCGEAEVRRIQVSGSQ